VTRAAWPTVRLQEVLHSVSECHRVDAAQDYPNLGIYSFGRGLFLKAPISGAATSARTLFRVRRGQFIYSRLFAFEGAYGLVSDELDGRFVSNEFPMFEADTARLTPEYLAWYFRIPSVWNEVAKTAVGMGDRRRRVQPQQLLRHEIPLPPLPQQHRIVAKLDELSTKVEESRVLRSAVTRATLALELLTTKRLFPKAEGSVLGDFARFQTGYAFKSEWFVEDGIRVARNVNIGHGHLDWSDTARVPMTMRDQFARFELADGDILVSLDRPVISTGVKAARVTSSDLPALLLQRVARARFDPDRLLPEYLLGWLRSPCFVGAIDPGRSNGVPHISHKHIEAAPFAAPPLPEQQRVLAQLHDIEVLSQEVRYAQAAAGRELDALMPAILDRAFKGDL
jgi:type I restriction enzyme, S subunit